MQREGANPLDMQAEDFLCDFCGRAWDGAFPMVEGHQGSLICGECLAFAYREILIDDAPNAPEGSRCTMCLEHRDEPAWRSAACGHAVICRRCCKQSAGRLAKDPDVVWRRPER